MINNLYSILKVMYKQLLSLHLLLILVVTAFLSSCGNNKDANPAPGNKNCLPTKVKSDTDKTEFIYDRNNRLTRVNEKENNTLVTYQTLDYNSSNQITKTTDFEMNGTVGQQVSYTIYEYNSNGLRSKVTSYSEDFGTGNLGANSYITYEYNTNAQITKSNNFAYGGTDFRLVEYTTFTYDSKGNIIKAASYDMINRLQYQLEIQYDDKANVIKTLPALTAVKYNFFAIPVILSKNNFTNIIIKAPFSGTNTLVDAGWITNTYTLNADGFINAINISLNLPAFIDDKIIAILEYDCK